MKGKITEVFRNYKNNRYLMLIFLPVLLYYIIFKYLPMYGVILAFKQYNFFDGVLKSPWVGLENFRDMFRGVSFKIVFANTFIFAGMKMLFGFPAPIFLAILFNELRNKHFKKITQTITYLPYFFSWVVIGGVIVQLLSPSSGPIGYIFTLMGLKPIAFMIEPFWFRIVILLSFIWKNIGWSSIVYIAAIAGINPELYEAAYVDGATRLKRIWNITIPCLLPAITIMFILNTGTVIIDEFDQIFNLYNVAVYSVGDVISTYTYRVGLVNMEYSFGTAVGLFKNIIALTLVLLTNTIAKRLNEYSLW